MDRYPGPDWTATSSTLLNANSRGMHHDGRDERLFRRSMSPTCSFGYRAETGDGMAALTHDVVAAR